MAHNKRSGRKASSTAVDFEVQAPLKIMEDNRRRFIRIDIAAPISFSVLRTPEGGFWPQGDGQQGEGEVLNISAGGILMFTEQPIMEGALLAMTLNLEDFDSLENVLGKVKRVDVDGNGYLIGIESLTREMLFDMITREEMEQISSDLASFTDRLRALLNQYIYSRKLTDSDNA